MNKNTIQLSIAAVALIAAALSVFFIASQSVHADNAYQSSIFYAATTSTSVPITVSTRVLATTTTGYRRIYATICNPSSNPVAINLNADKAANMATGNLTFIIGAAAGFNACYTINSQNLYQGSVQASSTNQTPTTVYVSDYQP